MSDDPHLTITDFRRLFCAAGVRRRFIEGGVDFEAFLRDGAPASQLLGRGYDGLIQKVIEAKEASDGR